MRQKEDEDGGKEEGGPEQEEGSESENGNDCGSESGHVLSPFLLFLLFLLLLLLLLLQVLSPPSVWSSPLPLEGRRR